MSEVKQEKRTRPEIWASSTYFAEGLPYSIVNNLAEILFKDMGASLGVIGLTSLFHLPWNLKFLWAPLADRYETKRRFMVWIQLALAVTTFALACCAEVHALLWGVVGLFFLLAFFSASNDIVIDGYYMEALAESEQAKYVGYRANAYRLASALVKGPLLILIGVVGWRVGLGVAAGLIFALALVHRWLLPRVEERKERISSGLKRAFKSRPFILIVGCTFLLSLRRFWLPDAVSEMLAAKMLQISEVLPSWGIGTWVGIILLLSFAVLGLFIRRVRAWIQTSDSDLGKATLSLLGTPRIAEVLAFVILFRTGESFLQKMKVPFLSRELGIDNIVYGQINGIGGFSASLVATFVGGYLISRFGLRRMLWPFLLAQNSFNLLYVALALAAPGLSDPVLPVTLVILCEEFGSGLGTVVLMVYLMRVCQKEHKASHFALLTALMSLSFTIAGASSGFLAERTGYPLYFGLSVLATIPMMVLALRVPHLDDEVLLSK